MLALLTLATVLAQAPLIDFVTVPPDQGEERQATYKFGGRPFHDPSPKKTLPLEIELLSISRPPGQPLAVIVEMNVRNVGPGPFLLPVGKDGNRAMKPANRGRQELSFALRGQGEPGMCGAGLSTFGSTDLPASLHTIPPGGAVRLRFAAEFSYQRLEQWETGGSSHLPWKRASLSTAMMTTPSNTLWTLPTRRRSSRGTRSVFPCNEIPAVEACSSLFASEWQDCPNSVDIGPRPEYDRS